MEQLIIALGGILTGGLAGYFARPKVKAESGQIIVQSAETTVGIVTEQMQRMEERLGHLESEVEEYRITVRALRRELHATERELRKAEARIAALEAWIKLNHPEVDPGSINGEPI